MIVGKVSGHSGLREEYELKQLEEKFQKQKQKRDEQMEIVCGVLDKMPPAYRRHFLSEVCKKYMKDFQR